MKLVEKHLKFQLIYNLLDGCTWPLDFHSDSVLRHASSDFKRMGQRIFIFMIGGATRSEVDSSCKLFI